MLACVMSPGLSCAWADGGKKKGPIVGTLKARLMLSMHNLKAGASAAAAHLLSFKSRRLVQHLLFLEWQLSFCFPPSSQQLLPSAVAAISMLRLTVGT